MFNRCISSACFVAKSGESMQGFSAIVDRCSGFDRGGVCCTSGFCFLRITTYECTHNWSIHCTWRRSSSSSLSSTAYDHAPLYASPLTATLTSDWRLCLVGVWKEFSENCSFTTIHNTVRGIRDWRGRRGDR